VITLDRWAKAQAAERAYWYPGDRHAHEARRHEEAERAIWIAATLGIAPETVDGRSVLDIGGGPQPIVAWPTLPLAGRTLLDPLAIAEDEPVLFAGVHVVHDRAEEYDGPIFDEAWGYNVLQHVVDPVRVLAVAMAHARRVRWFEWVDQPISLVHPHTITAATFRLLDAWRRVLWVEGVRDEGRGWSQAYVAGVWEAPS
jgi:hypothetical protein